jgi:uncharacterized membrane protein YraQ (UPF0718 family)
MPSRTELTRLAIIVGAFLALFYLPLDAPRFQTSLYEALALAKWYAREHVILCLVPAFFIAGAITCFVSQASVLRYLGPKAKKTLAYGVASVSGSILAVCSCTVLPLFAGIYSRGAGLGPACAFLYSGPAINILAIVLTAKVLGPQMGIARAVGAVSFSIVVGLLMHLIFRKEETARADATAAISAPEVSRPLWQNTAYLASMVAILVFANWAKPLSETGAYHAVYASKWIVTGIASAAFAVILGMWFGVRARAVAIAAVPVIGLAVVFRANPLIPFSAGIAALSVVLWRSQGEPREWLDSTWAFTKQILPLLLGGVLVSGALLGRPGHETLIPSHWITGLVGGNSILANLVASVVGAFMYFATLTEVPILQGLLGAGMGKGPALALLLAGPALSLPSIIVLGSIMGAKKTLVFVCLVCVLATMTGKIFGTFWG